MSARLLETRASCVGRGWRRPGRPPTNRQSDQRSGFGDRPVLNQAGCRSSRATIGLVVL